jgi:hypothetical protein
MSNYYNRNARPLFDKCQGLDPDTLHAHWLKHLPQVHRRDAHFQIHLQKDGDQEDTDIPELI